MSARQPALGIIADDVTGGLLVASYFEEAGLTCPVALRPDAVDQSGDISILATRSRLAEPEEARATITCGIDALLAAGCEAIAYKACASFDSTEQGNIGQAAVLLADRLGQEPLLVSAGFPEFRATVHQGYLFYQGRLVTESIKRLDPVTPMPDPDLRRFLGQQAGETFGLVSHLDLIAGPETAQTALEREVAAGHRFILLDSSDDADILASARLARGARAIVASDPLIIAWGRDRAAGRMSTPQQPPAFTGPGAVIVGSVGPVAEDQLAAFGASHPVYAMDVLSTGPEEAEIERALDWAAPRIGDTPFSITTLAPRDRIEAAQSALGQLGAARKAERLLSAVARGLHDRGIRRLVVAGGETSGATVSALGLDRLRAYPRGPLGGGFCLGEGAGAPISLFLKSGKLGSRDVLLQALDHMQSPERTKT